MRRAVAHKIFAIGLVLSRLVLADVMHLPTAQAAHHGAVETMIPAGKPCHEHGGIQAVDPKARTVSTERQMPAHDGACCKSSKCTCLQAPTLTMALQIPTLSGVRYADAAPVAVQRATWRETVFFRPPI
jgi:hypothetical protein